MVTRNDPGLRLHNGDVGIALPDPGDAGNLRVCFAAADGSVRSFAPARLPGHETAFAMTVHKSQGSEFDRVLLVLPERDSPLLTRELIYTGLTRARSSVELWADEPVLRAAIGRQVLRGSGLRDALWAPLSGDPSPPSA
jgi:exodeoxyribonuclease V alpha subunit